MDRLIKELIDLEKASNDIVIKKTDQAAKKKMRAWPRDKVSESNPQRVSEESDTTEKRRI